MLCNAFFSWRKFNTNKAEVLINGSLAGLVSISAVCNLVHPVVAICIGAVGGAVSILVSFWLERWQLDDAVDAIAVHLGGGLWGDSVSRSVWRFGKDGWVEPPGVSYQFSYWA